MWEMFRNKPKENDSEKYKEVNICVSGNSILPECISVVKMK
jgi:hypothetical protein